MKDPTLCYVRNNWAYFTFKSLDEQWGDDWNDAPYECNAGDPYWDEEGDIVKVAYDGEFETPDHNYRNSPYSVERINKGVVAWLDNTSCMSGKELKEKGMVIMAGTTLPDFIKKIKQGGGNVYAKV